MKLPAPTMRMRRETMKAAAQEKAIPRWAERRSLVMVTISKEISKQKIIQFG